MIDRPVTFRRAASSDREAVVALVFETLRSFGIEPEPEGMDADVMGFGQSDDPAVAEFVAEIDERVSGSVALRDRGDGTGRVSKLFVNEALRGRGIGRVLLELAVQAARAKKLRRLNLSTARNSKRPSISTSPPAGNAAPTRRALAILPTSWSSSRGPVPPRTRIVWRRGPSA